mgnify:CR=1 FL=1
MSGEWFQAKKGKSRREHSFLSLRLPRVCQASPTSTGLGDLCIKLPVSLPSFQEIAS